jgi:hypothetical protein
VFRYIQGEGIVNDLSEIMKASQQGKKTEIQLNPDGGYKVLRVCQDRHIPAAGKKDITLFLNRYIPFDQVRVICFIQYAWWQAGKHND